MEAVAAERLSAAPLAIQDTKFIAGVRAAEGIAVLSGAEGRLSARGHGPAGERLAARLAEHVRAWDRAGRPGRGLKVDVFALSGGPRSGVVLDKRHHRFVLSWPAVTR